MSLSPGAPLSEFARRANWRTVRFGDVVRNVDEAVRDPLTCDLERFVGLEHIDPESLRIKRWGLIADGTSFTRKFTAGQVLFGKRRAYQRKVAVADFDGLCSSDILVFEPADDRLLPELLPFIVQTEGFFQHALGTSAGSLSPRTRWRDLAAYEFPLPPLDEQRRNAEILWAAEDVNRSALEVVTDMQSVKAARLANLFDPVRAASRGWRIEPLENCAEVRTGIAKGKQYTGERTIEYQYLRVANLQDGYLDLSEMKTIRVPEREVARYLLLPNDVLLTEGGDFDKLGRGTVWRGEIEPCLHQNHIFCVRPDLSYLLPDFLSYQTGSSYGKQYFLKSSKQTTNLASINSTQVRAFPVLLPSLDEQKDIVAYIALIDQAALSALRYLEKSHSLKQQLIAHLL